MPSRAQLPEKDRNARSRLVQFLAAGEPFAQGSLITMARICGTKGCKCARGEKHVSLYLATRLGKKRKMLYVPKAMEEDARVLVENARRIEVLLEEMSQASLEHFVTEKKKNLRKSRS